MIRTLRRSFGRTVLVLALGVTAAVVLAQAASAAVTAASAYVWGYDPTAASYTIPVVESGPTWTTYFYARNDGAGPITVTRTAAGRYRVSFGGLAAVMPSRGVAHVAPYGATPNLCTVVSWVPVGGDLRVTVSCFDPGGAPADTRFVANVMALSGTSDDDVWGSSYLWADQPAADDYAPNFLYRHDATGGVARIIRDRAGTYRAHLPGSAPETTLTFYQTSAYATTAVACASVAYLGDGWVRVLCRDADGALVDSRFTLSYAPGNVLWRVAPTYELHASATAVVARVTWVSDSSLSHLVTVTRLGLGQYEVFLPEIVTYDGHAVAYSSSPSGRVCSVGGWVPDGSDMRVHVRCVNHAGVSADSSFFAALTW